MPAPTPYQSYLQRMNEQSRAPWEWAAGMFENFIYIESCTSIITPRDIADRKAKPSHREPSCSSRLQVIHGGERLEASQDSQTLASEPGGSSAESRRYRRNHRKDQPSVPE